MDRVPFVSVFFVHWYKCILADRSGNDNGYHANPVRRASNPTADPDRSGLLRRGDCRSRLSAHARPPDNVSETASRLPATAPRDDAAKPIALSSENTKQRPKNMMAEAGCSANEEIAAITGHATSAEVTRDTKHAEQKRGAPTAIGVCRRVLWNQAAQIWTKG